jgi:hypothetical protein
MVFMGLEGKVKQIGACCFGFLVCSHAQTKTSSLHAQTMFFRTPDD